MKYIKIGNKTFSTIQMAIDSIPLNNGKICINLGPGTYREKLFLNKPGVTIKGAGASKTRIVFGDYAKKPGDDGLPIETFETYTLFIGEKDCALENLTVENDAGPGSLVGQAVALYADGDRFTVKNCSLIAKQDTLFAAPLPPKPVERAHFGGPRSGAERKQNRMYFYKVEIHGDIDFIFGGATAVFDSCQIHSLAHEGGYITAASTPEDCQYGFIFLNCRLTGDASKGTVYLGRPWREYGKTLFIRCEYGEHIKEAGWHDWGKTHARQTIEYAEGEGSGPGYNPDKRVSWVKILNSRECEKYTVKGILSGKDRWDPQKEQTNE